MKPAGKNHIRVRESVNVYTWWDNKQSSFICGLIICVLKLLIVINIPYCYNSPLSPGSSRFQIWRRDIDTAILENEKTWGRGCEQLNLVSRAFSALIMKRQVQKINDVESVFTHLSGSYANLLEQKKVFTYEKGWTCTGLIWKTNMAAVSLFWNTNIADMVTSCEKTLFTICTSLRKKTDIWRRYHWFPRQMASEKPAQKFHTDDA